MPALPSHPELRSDRIQSGPSARLELPSASPLDFRSRPRPARTAASKSRGFACPSTGGALLVALGVLHLAVTPEIAHFIQSSISASAASGLLPPMLLNHVVLGILLLPIGGLTCYAAPYAARGERWAWVVSRVTATSVATLPVTLFFLMGARYFGAPAFVLATAILCAACLALLAAAFWP